MSNRECRLLGCARPHYARDLCQFHYDRWRYNRPLDAPYKYLPAGGRGPKPFFDWAECGTSKQYKKHLRHGIPVCEPCRRAENRRVVDSKARRSRDKENARRRALWAANPESYRRRQRERRALLSRDRWTWAHGYGFDALIELSNE